MFNGKNVSRKKQKNTFMGIDASFSGTGLIVCQGKETLFIDEISTEKKNFENIYVRIEYTCQKIIEQIKKYKPTLICLEDTHVSINPKTGIMLAALGAVLRYLLVKGKYPLFTAVPSQVKKFTTGSGNKKGKAVIIKEVYKQWQFDTDSDNVADAFAMSHLAQGLYCFDNDIPCDYEKKYQLEVYKALLKNSERFFNYDCIKGAKGSTPGSPKNAK